MNRTIIFVLMVLFILLAILLSITALGGQLVSWIFGDIDNITNSFAIVIAILVLFNWLLEIKSHAPYRPTGDSASLHKIFGPLGEIFNFGFWGFLIYEIFLTAITVLSTNTKLNNFIPTEPLYVLNIIMILLVGFCGYILVTMILAIWFSPAFKKEAKIVPEISQ